jgi:catechol 2,3-dioxygenase-like lactoylglutathione lyase family enzyme
MFDHISIGVSDLERSRRFYSAALEPLGYSLRHEGDGMLGYGPGNVGLWVAKVDRPVPADRGSGLHICFTAPLASAIDAFHRAGLAAGGTDNGAPGLRPDYSPNYYAAFLIDPDGFRLEAYCEIGA